MLPLARSIRNSAGFIAMRGEQPIEEKYSIASDAFPKYKEQPLPKRISLSNLLNSLLDGWCIVVTTVFPACKVVIKIGNGSMVLSHEELQGFSYGLKKFAVRNKKTYMSHVV